MSTGKTSPAPPYTPAAVGDCQVLNNPPRTVAATASGDEVASVAIVQLPRDSDFFFEDDSMKVFERMTQLRSRAICTGCTPITLSSIQRLPSSKQSSESSSTILLPMTTFEFKTLLRFFYDGPFFVDTMTLEACVAILSVAHVLAYAEKLKVRAEGVTHALQAVICREYPLDPVEIDKLSSVTVWRISRAREQRIRERTPLVNDQSLRQILGIFKVTHSSVSYLLLPEDRWVY
ncbi:hypothetical protein FA95DRAFT_1571177 [Auriscalpium vulgare]|uniref:Uncharacterized protein n=1 Tax=Auriscalpium vulgare TaxID=40419 RepID=A0ACB8S066_9AGAM|nr:hypothetical protein FA95DRAFT_1571177 [Auriscalpium vulgare]